MHCAVLIKGVCVCLKEYDIIQRYKGCDQVFITDWQRWNITKLQFYIIS